MVDFNVSSNAERNLENGSKTTPASTTLPIQTRITHLLSCSSDEEPILHRSKQRGESNRNSKWKMATADSSMGACSSKKGPFNRGEISRQIPILKMKIDILQDEMKSYQKALVEKDNELAKYTIWVNKHKRKINILEHEMKELRDIKKQYHGMLSESNRQTREIEELKKMNRDYERNYSKLEKKYDMLKQEHSANINNRPNEDCPSTSVLSPPILFGPEDLLGQKPLSSLVSGDPEDQFVEDYSSTLVPPVSSQAGEIEETLTDDEKFNRDLEAAIAASMAIKEPETHEKNDQILKQEINFALELSKKDDEIRKQREHSLAFEELFRKNVEAEREAKRKLVNIVTEKERVTKRLKVVEQEKETLADEKEKLVDELECSTLCGFCTENKKDAVFEPCGHIWACFTCVKSANMNVCPTCRNEIKDVKKVFIA